MGGFVSHMQGEKKGADFGFDCPLGRHITKVHTVSGDKNITGVKVTCSDGKSSKWFGLSKDKNESVTNHTSGYIGVKSNGGNRVREINLRRHGTNTFDAELGVDGGSTSELNKNKFICTGDARLNGIAGYVDKKDKTLNALAFRCIPGEKPKITVSEKAAEKDQTFPEINSDMATMEPSTGISMQLIMLFIFILIIAIVALLAYKKYTDIDYIE